MSRDHTATLKVIKGGRVTLPSEVRDLEHIEEGDYVEVTFHKLIKDEV